MKQEATKEEKSAGRPVAVSTVSTDISAIEDILQLLKVLYGISTTSAFDFGEGGKKCLILFLLFFLLTNYPSIYKEGFSVVIPS